MFTTVDQFFNEYTIKNGQFPNETVMNRGIMRLKREVRELKSMIDALRGNPIEEWNAGKVYEIDEYVSYHGVVYKSTLDSNIGMNPQDSKFWKQQNIESIKSKNQAFKYKEFVSDGVQLTYDIPFNMINTPAVFADGRLLSPTKFDWSTNKITLHSPVGNKRFLTVIEGLTYEAVSVQPKNIFTCGEHDYRFEVDFALTSPAVYVDGVYQTSGYTYGSSFVEFDDPLPPRTVVCVVNGAQGGIDLYSRTEINNLLKSFATVEDTFTKAEVVSAIDNAKLSVLQNETLVHKNDVYTKTEVDNKFKDLDMTDDVAAALDTKADKASTLLGYGILDAYDKTTTDLILDEKLNIADFNAASILDTIRGAEGDGTGLNADTLKGLSPEKFMRTDLPAKTTDSLTVKSEQGSVILNADGDTTCRVPDGPEGVFHYDVNLMSELNSRGLVVQCSGTFKGTWWDDIHNFGFKDPDLYHWTVHVQPLAYGTRFDFVPTGLGDGETFTQADTKGSVHAYGAVVDGVVKLYCWAKNKSVFTPVPAQYVICGTKKSVSSLFTRNQGDDPVHMVSFEQHPRVGDVTPKVLETPAPENDNALSSKEYTSTPIDRCVLSWSGHATQDGVMNDGDNFFTKGEAYYVDIRGGIAGGIVDVSVNGGQVVQRDKRFDSMGHAGITISGVDGLDTAPTVIISSPRCKTLTFTPELR